MDPVHVRHLSFSDELIKYFKGDRDHNLRIQHGYSIKDLGRMMVRERYDAIVSFEDLGDGKVLDVLDKMELPPLILIASGAAKGRKGISKSIVMRIESLDGQFYNIAHALNTISSLNNCNSCIRGLKDEMEQRDRWQDLAQRSFRRFSHKRNVRDLNMELYGLVKEELPCKGMTVSSYIAEKGKIKAEFIADGGEVLDVTKFPLLDLAEEGKGTQSQVIRTGVPLIMNAPRSGPHGRQASGKGTSAAKPRDKGGMLSSIYAPIALDGQLSGVLCVSGEKAYDESHAKKLQIISNQYAVSKKDASLFETTLNLKDRFESLFENAPLCYQSLDEKGIIVQVNSTWLESLGYQKEECIGKWFGLFLSPSSIERFRSCFSKIRSQGSVRNAELDLVKKDGNVMSCLFDGNVDYNTLRDVSSAHCVFKDITSERDTIDKLRLTQKTIDKASFEIFWIGPDGRFIYVNEFGQERLGYSLEELRGMHVHDIDPLYTKEIRSNTWSEIKEKGLKIFQSIHKTHSGKEYPVLITSQYMNYKGGEFEFAYATDITELKELENEMIRYQDHLKELVEERTAELMQSNEELQQFAYAASHDLQEPLRMVTNYLQLLKRKYVKDLDENAIDYIEFAVDGSKRMQALINDLLVYSRIGSHELNLEEFNAIEPLNIAIGNLGDIVEGRKADIRIGGMPEIYADKSLVALLFQNLLSNAIKFTEKDKYPRVDINSQVKGDKVIFSIKDNGIGIDEKYMSTIFKIFKRLHTRDEYPGTGLGLAMCKRVVERHKGSIWAKSEKEKGSIFYFSIPIKK
ncbi:MAG TPA: PAS domain S-box protein [Candidatus Methanofastidiosa archaeon]|nr:PAS domain S-box protein [Candidatus Methanofastidiosa archaeon]